MFNKNVCEEEKDKLKICIEKYEERISNLLDTLEWTQENTLKVHKSESDQPLIRQEKYDKNDPLYPDTLIAKNSIKLDIKSLQQIFKSTNKVSLPQKFTDFQIQFNREEKLSLYEYVINKTGHLTEPEVSVLHINDNKDSTNSTDKEMTFSEIVALRRDQKRRRLKHRTTKIPPLSVTEELRHVIDIQMQAYNQYLTQSVNKSINNEKTKDRKSSLKEHKRKRKKSNKDKTSHHKHKKNKRTSLKK